MNFLIWFGLALAGWTACSFVIGCLIGRMFGKGWEPFIEDEDV